ncbi:MAG: hypothetical protein KUG77_11170 [Nannocystaceae bacterium]|nr:hypothetical protein [Nannocystaceae bacterium]
MSLTVCSGCRRHVRDGDGCPFCGGRPATTAHLWKAAVLTAMMPLGLAACYGVPQTPGAADAGKTPASGGDPTQAEPVELDSAIPDPSGHDPGPPDPEPDPEPSQDSAPVDDADAGDSTKPDGTDTPIVPDTRPARKYGAPPRPDVDKPQPPKPPRRKTKYGAPPRPLVPKPAPE